MSELGEGGAPEPRAPTVPVDRVAVRGKGRKRRRSLEKARREPRPPAFAFWKGAAIGAVVILPLIAASVWVLAHLGIGDRTVPWIVDLRFTAIFAGAATVLTAGGIGRLAAQASVEEGGGPKRAVFVAARAQAVAGAGLVVLAAIPHGHLPHAHASWLWFAIAGAIAGAAGGALIGAFCAGPGPVSFSDVVAVARWPAEALRAGFRGELPSAPRIVRRKRPR